MYNIEVSIHQEHKPFVKSTYLRLRERESLNIFFINKLVNGQTLRVDTCVDLKGLLI